MNISKTLTKMKDENRKLPLTAIRNSSTLSSINEHFCSVEEVSHAGNPNNRVPRSPGSGLRASGLVRRAVAQRRAS